MRKRDALGALAALTAGLLSMGDGIVLAVPMLAVAGYLLLRSRTRPTRDRLTAAVAALAR